MTPPRDDWFTRIYGIHHEIVPDRNTPGEISNPLSDAARCSGSTVLVKIRFSCYAVAETSPLGEDVTLKILENPSSRPV